jgi:tripartite-type tricarboxylate transporter receptor subunit TctC
MNKTVLAFLAAAALLPMAQLAQSQAYPARAVRLVVPSSPGGGTDASARILAPRLSELLGQQVVVENRPGAATMIGLEVVAKSPPDGYTLVMANSTMAILPSMRRNLRMDVIRGFTPITLVASNPQMLVSHPSLPVKTLKQLIAFARARPGTLDYASGGYGGNPHMCMELLLSMTGLKITYVPYKSGNAGLTDVLGGQVPIMMASVLSALPHVRNARLRAYGVTTAQRFSSVPDIPTIAEAGVPGYDATQWFGILAPAGTPRDIIARLHGDVGRALKDPEVRKRFVADGSDTVASGSPEEFAAYIRADEAKWAKVVKDAGLKPE